ncbi:MAG TPA: hypothetical protein V6C99_09040 [Oculatellaceae cyanobacterium]
MSLRKTVTPSLPMILQFSDLKKRLWIGTLLLDAVMTVVVAWLWPQYLRQFLGGCMLGVFYLWSLMFSAEHPRHKLQAVFSLIRIVFLAYPVVSIAGRDVHALALVMCGLLSYKVLLAVETVLQAMPAFRQLKRSPAEKPPEARRPENGFPQEPLG